MSTLSPLSITSERSLKIVQTITRLAFAVLATFYFAAQPALFLPAPAATLWLLLAAYVIGHGLLLVRPRFGKPLAPAIDLLALTALLVLDPGDPPPTLALLIVAVLSAGLLHSLQRYLITLVGAVLALTVAFFLRHQQHPETLISSSWFLLASLAVCVGYFTLMLYRTQNLARRAEAATWQDPETGLISRAALSHTAGWLLPLHDRLSSPLTVSLLEVDDSAQLAQLSRTIIGRLRRSDVAARFDGTIIAVMFPCTGSEAAEKVLGDLHEQVPGLRGAVVSVSNPDTALEQVLGHLHQSLSRARADERHWLSHATSL